MHQGGYVSTCDHKLVVIGPGLWHALVSPAIWLDDRPSDLFEVLTIELIYFWETLCDKTTGRRGRPLLPAKAGGAEYLDGNPSSQVQSRT